MNPIHLYPDVRLAHITLVLTSAVLFTARGVGVLAGARWCMTPLVRRLSVVIDTALLGAALLLLHILQLNPFAHAWLATKMVLLLVYIVLGTYALRRGRTPRIRLQCFIAALFCLGFMASVARTHSPFGAYLWL